MFTAILKSLVLLWCLCFVLSSHNCSTYKTQIRPLIENGDVTSLEKIFEFMNKESHAILTYRLLPIDNTVWPEVSAIKMLISLSRPLMEHIGESNTWPENNNIRMHYTGPADELSPKTSYHAGLRYIYNCETIQTASCFKGRQSNKGVFDFYQNRPILTRYSEDIFVPLENLISANGDAMSEHLMDEIGFYRITGCNRLAVRECASRQVFYNVTNSYAGDCLENLKFFSLPENMVAKSVNEDTSDPKKNAPQGLSIEKQYFIVVY